MTLLEEIKEKYKEGRGGDFKTFLKYLADHEPCAKEDSKSICDFLGKNLTLDELIEFSLMGSDTVKEVR
ncbi:hypothetical protein SM086_004176 [Cronobacter sakazakii]|nr:hypothetical protein [Cronobacter sakazakii]